MRRFFSKKVLGAFVKSAMNFKHNQPQQEIGDFLSDKDIIQLILTCKAAHPYTFSIKERKRKAERRKRAAVVFDYFTNFPGNLSTCMCAEYDSNYKKYVTDFFELLPELFQDFLEKSPQIKWFIMSWLKFEDGTTSREFTKQFDMQRILDQLIGLIKNNRTLYGCGLGLFNDIFDVTALKTMLDEHPTLKCISLWRVGDRESDGDTLYKE